MEGILTLLRNPQGIVFDLDERNDTDPFMLQFPLGQDDFSDVNARIVDNVVFRKKMVRKMYTQFSVIIKSEILRTMLHYFCTWKCA